MIKDITLGQFFPGNTYMHKLDPRVKLVICFAFIIVLFVTEGIIPYALAALFIVLGVKVSKTNPKMLLKSLKPIMFLVLFTSILNIFYVEGEVLVSFWILSITKEGLLTAFYMTSRIVMLVCATSLLMYTTSPIALTDALEHLLAPLNKIKFPVHEFSMMMTIAMRFIPTLIEETDKIMAAQKARGADFESGNIFARAKALIPILVPLFVSSFRRADELATAMECRLYQGGTGRTRLNVLKLTKNDYVFMVFCTIFFVIMIITSVVGI
ncbi:MAG: energy-coupling factor transporter transmembrane protein EcfT [Clostridia bacterium]|nr:energy-coupling factor transporter transmembrane protein EcfT [Clostridia bacterium]